MKRLIDFPLDSSSSKEASTMVMPVVIKENASLQAHVKLQQHQEEFLAWLENNKADGKQGEFYRKIR